MRERIASWGLVLLVVSGLEASCRAPATSSAPPSNHPDALASQPAIATQRPENDGEARARSHQHADAEAVITLASRDRGDRDIPPFEIYVFEDGCFRGEFGYQLDKLVLGSATRFVVHRILQDAESLGVGHFSETYELPDNPMPDFDLEVRCGEVRKHIRYSPVMDEYRAQLALEHGEAFAREIFIVHLLGARVSDMINSRR